MEALLLLIGELVFAILAPFVFLCIEFVASLLGLTLSLSVGQKAQSIISSRGARLFTIALLALAALLLSAIWVVNSFYFDTAVRHVFGMAEERSDISASCKEIDGSIFAGRVDLRECTIRRPSHPSSSFDLSAEEVFLDIRIMSLLGTANIETARIAGLDGWVVSDRSNRRQQDNVAPVEKPKRQFVIDKLDVMDVSVTLSGTNPDGNVFELPVEIDQIESEPLRSRLALFDVLFRSNMTGSIAGAPFEVATSIIQDGRQTTWRADRVPVASLGAMTGGPLSWFSAGYVNVAVDDQWQRSDALSIDMDWRLNFEDVEVNAPSGTGALGRMASEPLTRYVNSLDGHFPLEFQVVVNESQFEFKSSLAAAGLWSAVGESINNILGKFGFDPETASETRDAIKEGAKSVLDKLRKPKGEKSDQ